MDFTITKLKFVWIFMFSQVNTWYKLWKIIRGHMFLAFVQIGNIYINFKNSMSWILMKETNQIHFIPCKIQASVMKKNPLNTFNVWQSLRTSEAHSANWVWFAIIELRGFSWGFREFHAYAETWIIYV